MEKIFHHLVQGSPEWKAHRAKHFNASEAAAMLGIDPKTSRSELLRMMALGGEKEFSDYVQKKILDKGHEHEAVALPWAEEIIGEDLYPATVSIDLDGLALSASFDGLNMNESTTFEHKSLNAEIEATKRWLPHHAAQMEQGLLVSGAEMCLFIASDGNRETAIELYYLSDPKLRAQIIAGWKQFAIDLANYQHVEVLPAPVGKAIETLPTLTVRLIGEVTESNLDLYKERALAFIADINTSLITDQDFADAEKTIKFCSKVEQELELVKKQALSQTQSIEKLFSAVDEIHESMRDKRLFLDKLVTKCKESRRWEIIQQGVDAFTDHIDGLNKTISPASIPKIASDFAGVIKGKKLVEKMLDAINTELARVKIIANEIHARIKTNQLFFSTLEKSYHFLFPDISVLVLKEVGDFENVINVRVIDHNYRESTRLSQERDRIRNEEIAKIERERIETERVTETKNVGLTPLAPIHKVNVMSAPITLGWQAAITDINTLYEFVTKNEGFEHWVKIDYDAIKQYAASTRGTCPIPGIQFIQQKKEA